MVANQARRHAHAQRTVCLAERDIEAHHAAAVFTLDFDSELIYVGDSGISEPSDPTRRYGFEVAAFWNPVDWLAFDASYAYSHSRFKDAPSNFDRVPNTVEGVAAAGVTWHAGVGEQVTAGQPLFTLHTDTPERFAPGGFFRLRRWRGSGTSPIGLV